MPGACWLATGKQIKGQASHSAKCNLAGTLVYGHVRFGYAGGAVEGIRFCTFVYGHVRLLDGSHGSQDPCSAFSYMGTSTLSQMAQNEFLAYKAAE